MFRSAAFAAVLLTTATAFAAPVPIGKAPRGQIVTVAGKVTRITDTDAFRLRDESGVAHVYTGPNDLRVSVGEEIELVGAFEEDSHPPEFVARAIRRQDGSVTSLRHDWS
jgi:uncharacterized protein YdeI (BOF family)